MSAEEEVVPAEDASDDAASGAGAEVADWLLGLLTNVANKLNSDQGFMSVTLFTSAGTFAGMLTSNRRWFRLFQEAISGAGGQGAAELADSLEEIDDMLVRWNADENSSVGFVHLQNAMQLRGTEWEPLSPTNLWRGRVTEITGWTLGAPK